MKIIIDKYVPFIEGVLEPYAEVIYADPADINPNTVKDVDALIVRTRTKCNEALLKDSKVRFVATATIGYDHIDAAYCEQQGIVWQNAAGCNATAVKQYVGAAIITISHIFSNSAISCISSFCTHIWVFMHIRQPLQYSIFLSYKLT